MQGNFILSFGMKEVADAPMVITIIAERDTAFRLGDRGKVEMRPTALLKQMTDQVIRM